MDLPARAQLYAFVHPLCWPWLWFQLWRLQLWIQSSKRDVLFRVDRYGNLYVDFISDAPRDPSRYAYEAPAVPAWAPTSLKLSRLQPGPRVQRRSCLCANGIWDRPATRPTRPDACLPKHTLTQPDGLAMPAARAADHVSQ